MNLIHNLILISLSSTAVYSIKTKTSNSLRKPLADDGFDSSSDSHEVSVNCLMSKCSKSFTTCTNDSACSASYNCMKSHYSSSFNDATFVNVAEGEGNNSPCLGLLQALDDSEESLLNCASDEECFNDSGVVSFIQVSSLNYSPDKAKIKTPIDHNLAQQAHLRAAAAAKSSTNPSLKGKNDQKKALNQIKDEDKSTILKSVTENPSTWSLFTKRVGKVFEGILHPIDYYNTILPGARVPIDNIGNDGKSIDKNSNKFTSSLLQVSDVSADIADTLAALNGDNETGGGADGSTSNGGSSGGGASKSPSSFSSNGEQGGSSSGSSSQTDNESGGGLITSINTNGSGTSFGIDADKPKALTIPEIQAKIKENSENIGKIEKSLADYNNNQSGSMKKISGSISKSADDLNAYEQRQAEQAKENKQGQEDASASAASRTAAEDIVNAADGVGSQSWPPTFQ